MNTESEKTFSCQCCGHCCHGTGTVSLSPADQESIAAFLKLKPKTFIEQYCVIKKNRTEMKIEDGHCIFYGNDGLCMIHEVKPFHCRQWPLHPSILGDQGAWEAIKSDCPGFDPDMTYSEACDLVKNSRNES